MRLTGSALLLWSIGNSKNNSGDLAGEPFGKTLFLFYQEFTQPDNPFTRTYLSNPWFFGQSWLDVLNFMLIFFFAFFTFSSGLVFSAKLYQVAEIVVKHWRLISGINFEICPIFAMIYHLYPKIDYDFSIPCELTYNRRKKELKVTTLEVRELIWIAIAVIPIILGVFMSRPNHGQ